MPPLLCALILWSASALPETMTHEEMVAREAYAKLAYAAQLAALHRAISDTPQLTQVELDARIAVDDLHFVLTDLTSGTLPDIARRPIGDFVSRSGDDILTVQPDTFRAAEGIRGTPSFREVSEQHALVMWTKGIPMPGEALRTPAGEIFGRMEHSQWFSRYAAFTVTLAFQGRSTTYRAIFLFGRNDKGEEEVIPADNVTGAAALSFFVRNDVYPATLLETKLASLPAIKGWIERHRVSAPSCSAGSRKACCDLATLKCGVATGGSVQ